MPFTPPSLKNLCFLQVVRRLEDYSFNVLALLPTTLRHKLLFRLPVVDICHLEKTCFVEGIDMEVFWGELLKRHVARYDKNTQHPRIHKNFIHNAKSLLMHPLKRQIHHNRELYNAFIAAVVLNDARPSGYFLHNHHIVPQDHRIITDGPQDAQPHDIVNYLVCSCVEELFTPLEDEVCADPVSSGFHNRPITCCFYRTCDSLTVPSLVSPIYTEACKARQLAPPRYQHYFPSGSYRLSDLDALQLLADCQPQLRILVILSLAAFDNTTWGELSGVLTRLFAGVECAQLNALKIGKVDNTMIKSLAPLLSAQPIGTTLKSVSGVPFNVGGPQAPFCALTELKIVLEHSGFDIDTVSALTSIVEHQNKLQVLTVSNLPDFEGVHHWGAYTRLSAALQSLLQQPTFRSLSLCNVLVRTLPLETAGSVLQSFLSSPCPSYQSLEFESIRLYPSSDLPPMAVRVPDCAQEHKSLTLRCTSQLAAWLLNQKEVKLKSLTINLASSLGDSTNPVYLQHKMQHLTHSMAHHPSFHVQKLILQFYPFTKDFESTDCIEDFGALLANPSLKKFHCECQYTTHLAVGFLKQATEAKLGNLQELMLRTTTFHPVLFNALFTLPELYIISVSLTKPSWVEHMFKAWKQNSCPRLQNFAVCLPPRSTVSDKQKAMLDEMCVQYPQNSYQSIWNTILIIRSHDIQSI